jgi:hypothetical protein
MIKELKYLFHDFRTFFRKDFKILPYGYTMIVIACSIFFIYTTDIEKDISKGYLPTSNKYINNLLLYAGMYFIIAVPVLILQKKYKEISKRNFYLKGIFLITVISIANIFSWRDVLDLPDFNLEERRLIFRTLWRACNIVFVLPMLLLLRFFVDRQQKGLYGLCRGNHHIKAYLWLFVIILPILIFISFTPGFLSYYPMGKSWEYEGLFGNPAWINTLIYETIYMSDFVMVELIFRGALVIGMGMIMGRSAVLPMVAVYVTIHFGKPVMETISAIFGGYFLGALAFQSKHIWGGVIIHMGIAFSIEIIRIIQHYTLGI